MDEIYKMELHESLHHEDGFSVLRVPGGWIYTSYSETGTGGYSQSSCFVPFDNEFQRCKPTNGEE